MSGRSGAERERAIRLLLGFDGPDRLGVWDRSQVTRLERSASSPNACWTLSCEPGSEGTAVERPFVDSWLLRAAVGRRLEHPAGRSG